MASSMLRATLSCAVLLLSSTGCGSDESSANGGGAGASAGSANGGTSGAAGTTSGGAGAGAGGTSAAGASGGAGDAGASAGTAGASGGGGTPGTITECDGNCRYVRAAATGSGDGSNWDDAYPDLPADLVRGQIYFVAAGDYATYEFDDAADGTTTIRILRATAADHGDASGWDESYAAGEAAFGELVFSAPYVEFDGRGATRAVGGFQSTVVDIAADAVTFANTDVDGAFELTADQHTGGACTAMNVAGNEVVIRGNHIHDAADDGVSVSGSSNLSFEGNEVDHLYGCGTDGGCGPCYNGHSDGLEIYAVQDSEFVGNFLHDVASTSTFFFGNWADELGDGPNDYCSNILLANNLMYNPDTGFVAYIEDAVGVRLYNNTIWGAHQGAYGGLSVGMNVDDLTLVNNVILSINFAHIGGSFDAAQHHSAYNLFGISLGQWTDDATDFVAVDPKFEGIPDADGAKVDNPTPEDFTPQTPSPMRDSGTSDSAYAIPSSDFFGTTRDATPNVGAIE